MLLAPACVTFQGTWGEAPPLGSLSPSCLFQEQSCEPLTENTLGTSAPARPPEVSHKDQCLQSHRVSLLLVSAVVSAPAECGQRESSQEGA